MIHYELINTTSQSIDEQAIKRALDAAARKLKLSGDRHVIIELVTPEESEQLNHELRGKNEPTDILSIGSQELHEGEQIISEEESGVLHFDLVSSQNPSDTWPVLGQLIICFDIVAQNAKRAGQDIDHELEWVVEHGVLHLAGFHHKHDE